MEETMDIGKRIAYYRDGMRWSNGDLARASGVSHSVIYGILRGKHAPSLKTLRRLCDALKITEKCLFCEECEGSAEVWDRLSPRQKISMLTMVDTLFDKTGS